MRLSGLSNHLLSFTITLAALSAGPMRADQLVHADGRREEGRDVRQDDRGRWTAELEGRRVLLRPGDIIATIDDAGKEVDLIPRLLPDGRNAADDALLASLAERRSEAWVQAVEALGQRRTRGVFSALVELAGDKDKDLRGRAITALCRLATRESVVAATEAVLGEKDRALRRLAASTLFSVQEVFRRCDLAAATEQGLADQDGELRITFALLAPRDCAAAVPVLLADGLGSRDHHTRESAALELGHRGDAAGEKVLAGMLARTKLPGLDDAELNARYLVREQVEVCAVFGGLRTKTAVAALEKARRSPHAAVRTAAEAARAAARSAGG